MIRVIAILCRLSDPTNCHEQLVTSSSFADISLQACLVGVPALADWMKSYPQYRLAKWRCSIGEPTKEGA